MKQIVAELSWVSASRAGILVLVLGLLFLGTMRVGQAQNKIRVPRDYATIQDAVDNANPGDEIEVGRGRWCGAIIDKPLELEGDDAVIIACPSNFQSAPGLTVGFRLLPSASGSMIVDFVFDGRGYSDADKTPLALGISAQTGTNDVTVEDNRFLGGGGGISANGSGWRVSKNVFSGFTIISPSDFYIPCFGGFAIASEVFLPLHPDRFTDNAFTSNTVKATVPEGDLSLCSWVLPVDSPQVYVPFAGIVVAGQDSAKISGNKISIASNSGGNAGAGVIAGDALSFPSLTTINTRIKSNDGRKSKYALIIPLDQSAGTGNTVGARISDNSGINIINGVKKKVK